MRYQFKDFLLVGPFTNFLKVKREKGKNKMKVGGGKRERQKERERRKGGGEGEGHKAIDSYCSVKCLTKGHKTDGKPTLRSNTELLNCFF